MKTAIHQKLPTNWDQREKLRDKGQFWTPAWVADAMVAYVAQGADLVFDPGVGKGAFYDSLKKLDRKTKFYGTDIDPTIIDEAKSEGIFDDNSKVEVRDFILNPPQKLFKAIVANPPYIRHHRLSLEQKNQFRKISLVNLGSTLDGRAGLHIYFLIQALTLLDKGGRLAFIMPADTCEGVFSKKLWSWISKKYCIDGVITFEHKATPFPGVDTNAVIFLVKNEKPKEKITWAKCLSPQDKGLFEFLKNDLVGKSYKDIDIYERDLMEALSVGLSRAPRTDHDYEFTLTDFARVVRGIATGANEFFFLTREKAKEAGIPDKYFIPAVGRTRDAEGSYLTKDSLLKLEGKGRPTLLFFPNGSRWDDMPETVKTYILNGEKAGLSKRALISTRQPWYKMEVREIPIFLFSYLGRRNARFIKNEAGIVPLTGFLCVYPRSNDAEYIKKLWTILQDPNTIANLQLVGKSYGSGAIKVEPRSLERLPISSNLVHELGLKPIRSELSLFS
ncbi:MAG: N6 adenine-specific DNA methyltransferase [Parcubacteria group bacterium GW2011_GWA1_42_7]|nr:MAG: N6 adenine-specific DNA methyltransferase [Parcubacteria group bacterium GW2011_GWB1_42_6]KKS69337.1 MAG: N6 adenine-specific DNA methyltransferase [Parcubacteria group bacterium GW2011_GWA1_42_7]KKS92342.1 MAG: N6 adenine-specific DNA methyltransferase [Parcubacteria group bacterium GW2011_GWC1_43_12]